MKTRTKDELTALALRAAQRAIRRVIRYHEVTLLDEDERLTSQAENLEMNLAEMAGFSHEEWGRYLKDHEAEIVPKHHAVLIFMD